VLGRTGEPIWQKESYDHWVRNAVELERIRPAPYVGRYKWILLERLDVLGDEELEGLIRQSYEMVATKGKTKAKTKTKAKAMKVKVNVKGSNRRGHEGHRVKARSSADN
jgi:hypothetical protein